MSGPFLAVQEPDAAVRQVERVLAAAGLTLTTMTRLRDLPSRELLRLQSFLEVPLGGAFGMGETRPDGPAGAMGYGPTLDGKHVVRHPFVPDAPPHAEGIPLLVGSTSHDPALLMAGSPEFATLTDERAAVLAQTHYGDEGCERYRELAERYPAEPPRLRYARLVGDKTFRAAAMAMAAAKAGQAAPVYAYEFAHVTDVVGTLIGAGHSVDLPFAFYNVDRAIFAGQAPTRHETSRRMALAWVAFARTGNPNHPDIPHWPAFDESRQVMRIAAEFEVFEQLELGRDPRLTAVG